MASVLERLLGAVRSRSRPSQGTDSVGGGERASHEPGEQYIAGDGWGTATSLSWAPAELLGKTQVSHPYRESVVWRAAVKALAEPFSRLPLRLWDREPSEDGAKDIGEGQPNHPLVKLWRNPNKALTGPDLWRLHMIGYREGGETYLFLAGLDGKPLEPKGGLERIEIPAQVIPVFKWNVTEVKPGDAVVGYRYGGQPDSIPTFPPGSVIRILDHDPYGWGRGYGDGQVLGGVFDLTHQSLRYLAAFVRSGGDPGAWIKHKHPINSEEKQRLQVQTDEEFGTVGVSRYRHISGDIEIIQNPVRPRDMEYEKLLKYSQSQILALCGVPPPIIADLERATYQNIQTAERLMWRGPNGILSTVRRTEDALNMLFLPRVNGADPRWRYRFDTSQVEVLQEDGKDELKLAAEIASRGVGVSVADALEALGAEAPLPEDAGQERWLARNLRTAEDRAGETVASALSTLAAQVASGAVPPDAAQRIAMVAFPGSLEPGDAAAIFPEPPPAPDPPPAPPTDQVPEPPPEGEENSAARAGSPADVDRGSSPNEARAAYSALDTYAFRPGRPIDFDKRLAAIIDGWLGDYRDAQLELWKGVAAEEGASLTPISELLATEPGGHRYRDDIPESLLRKFTLAQEEWAAILATVAGPRTERIFFDALAATQADLGGAFISATDPRVLEFFAKQRLDFTRITETLTEEMRDVLFSALTGETGTVEVVIARKLPELDEGLKRVFGTKEARANAISRTETGRAQNGAQYLQMREAGVSRVGWRHSGNPNGREDHTALDGIEVPIGQKFTNGLLHPHDPAGDASDVVNCSCAIYAAAFEGDDA